MSYTIDWNEFGEEQYNNIINAENRGDESLWHRIFVKNTGKRENYQLIIKPHEQSLDVYAKEVTAYDDIYMDEPFISFTYDAMPAYNEFTKKTENAFQEEYGNFSKFSKTDRVVIYGLVEARARGTEEDWHISRELNSRCAEAIITTINDNYRNNRLDTDKVVAIVRERFSDERITKVLAHEFFRHDYMLEDYCRNGRYPDGRISRKVADWAVKNFLDFENEESSNYTYCRYLCDETHAVLADAFAETFIDTLEKEKTEAIKNNEVDFADILNIDDEISGAFYDEEEGEIFDDFLCFTLRLCVNDCERLFNRTEESKYQDFKYILEETDGRFEVTATLNKEADIALTLNLEGVDRTLTCFSDKIELTVKERDTLLAVMKQFAEEQGLNLDNFLNTEKRTQNLEKD